ncbi:MAG: hypothetical protein ABW148_06080 [Sedimenticola sp.]
MIQLSENDTKALTALAVYQYLTPSQMERLGVGTRRAYIRDNTLARLLRVRPALINAQDFGVIPRIGRLERIYYLTEHGAQIAADFMRCDISEIVFPRFGVRYRDDYFHRKHHVNFHIALRQWIEAGEGRELEFFDSYYTKTKRQRSHSINQILFKPDLTLPAHYRKTIEPDGIFRFSKSSKVFLCAVEIHRKADSKYITKQLDAHMTALDQSLLADKYDQPTDNLVLSVHESVSSFKSVQKRLLSLPEFERFIPFFHFTLTDSLTERLDKKWILANGEKSTLFI